MANANVTLPELLRDRLRAAPRRRLTWAEVMRLALYEPGLGYYRRGVRRIGRKGDFFTSVSVGPLFGQLIAEFAHQTWAGMGRPGAFTLIEQGAHDGTLARDVLEGCQAVAPELFEAVTYVILEPDPALRKAQKETMEQGRGSGSGSELGGKLHHDPAVCTGPALYLCNELLDAFPVHRVLWDGNQWKEWWVHESEAAGSGAEIGRGMNFEFEFEFVEGELSDAAVAKELHGHGGPELPAGWTTEVCPAVVSWVDDLARMPFTGAVLILDYGFTAAEHFAPERSEGTLRRYLNHRMDGRVLEDLGETDLTAHVDFTRVQELAQRRGFVPEAVVEQGRFLTRLFVESFARHGVAPDAATQRQFHTLTHPGHMGRSFHALVLRKEREG